MLEITKIQYTEKPSDTHPDATVITGGLSMHCALTADNREQVPRDVLKDEIAERIWHQVYGDLLEPIWKLSRLASIYVPPSHQNEVLELREKLNALLTRKSPNEKLTQDARP